MAKEGDGGVEFGDAELFGVGVEETVLLGDPTADGAEVGEDSREFTGRGGVFLSPLVELAELGGLVADLMRKRCVDTSINDPCRVRLLRQKPVAT